MERKARDIPELLRELAGWKARADGGLPITVPVVTLWLRSGARATGLVEDVRDVERGRDTPTVLLLQLPEDRRQDPSDAIHVPLAAIEALTVHDDLRAGQARQDAPGPSSKLELMRRLKPLEDAVRAAGVQVQFVVQVKDEGADALRALETLAAAARTALEKVASEEDGKAALQPFSEVRLAIGRSTVAVEGAALVLATPVEMTNWPTAEQLVLKIESAL
ncbi:MAG TPA: hypothetical protein VFA20_26185 [Myxococcaceae bacterium]|nr:hypothetical protein [Myxococcaceae bacterium]